MTNPSLQNYVDWKDWADDAFGQLDINHARYFHWHVQRAIGEPSQARVLEIGFGNGAFLGYCRRRGWDVVGVEIDARLRARADCAGFKAVSNMSALPDNDRYDLIVLFDVLEHVASDELVDFLGGLALRLSPGAALLLRVPNGDSPFGRHHQHGDLTHVTTFGSSKLVQLAQLCRLRVSTSGESPWNAQQHEPPGIRSLCRASVRYMTARIFGFAFFHRRVDLQENLVAVLVRDEGEGNRTL